ncbi:MAG: hypothetical protein A2Y21_05035 [Clostridiales bacterium GWC2_40_7]|nr:MAG: hypothetical protein A2Y21_05035 [Clostridiales bacterium GWC2_40_7]
MNDSGTDSVELILSQFIKAHRQIKFIHLAKLGLYPGQPPLLAALCRNNGCSQKELVNSLSVKPPTIAVTIRRMVKAGLLECRSDTRDMRKSKVFITDKGRELNSKVEEITMEIEDECFKGFTEVEKTLIRRFLIQMRDNLLSSIN